MKIYYPDVKYYKINNNFKVILVETTSNIISASITIDVGSIDEIDKEAGLAHFFEHMIFKGTSTQSSLEIAQKLENIGAQSNASTDFDSTTYYISGNKKHYKEILSTLLDLFLNPIFPEEDIKNEINVVIEEFRMMEDNHSRKTYQKLMEIMYKNTDSKYAVPVIGKPDNIINFTRDNLQNFYDTHYKKADKILSLIGSMDSKKIIAIIEKIFDTKLKVWKPKFIKFNNKLEIPFYNKNLKPNLQIINTPSINQYIITIGFRSVNLYNKWNLAANIVSTVLTNGMTSRLFILLRNKLGLTYYQGSFSSTYTNHGFFCINYGVRPDGLELSLKEILKELETLKKTGITEDELIRSKNKLETSLLFEFQNMNDYGSSIIDDVLHKINPNWIKNGDEIINNIKIKYINQYILKVFKKSNMFIVINGHEINLKKINSIINKYIS
jgi:predicted Zn-dependent peptidase